MRTQSRIHTRAHARTAFAAATAVALVFTAACSTDDATEVAGSDGTRPVVEIVDGWAKATDTEMSGVFGTIHNNSAEDVHLTGVSGEIDGSHELHETVPGGGGMMMQEKEDGFVIPGGGDLVLEPGGNHIMLMNLTEPITTGQEIVLTLELGDGTEQEVTISARDFVGGEEEYVGGDHGQMGMNGGADHDG